MLENDAFKAIVNFSSELGRVSSTLCCFEMISHILSFVAYNLEFDWLEDLSVVSLFREMSSNLQSSGTQVDRQPLSLLTCVTNIAFSMHD